MKSFFICFLLIFLDNRCFGQEKIKVRLNETANSTFYRLVNGTMGLCMYDINEECLSKFKQKIIFPEKLDFEVKDTAYAELTKKSTQVHSFKSEFHFLIYNYKEYNPILFISPSNDFSDAQRFDTGDHNILKLSLNTDIGTLINYYLKMDTTKDYMDPVGIIHHLGCNPIEMKYNISLTNDFAKVGKSESFSIALYDANHNGSFNEIGVDQIFVGLPGEKYFLLGFDKNQTITGDFIDEKIVMQVRNKKFEILEIDKSGDYVIIKPCSEDRIATIKQFEYIPDIKVQLSNGDSLNLRKIIDKKKYIYVEIWTKTCPGCIAELPIMNEIAEKYKSKLNFIGLYDKGDLMELNNLIIKYGINTNQALSSTIANYNFSLDGYPYGLLFSKDGKLIKTDVNSKKLIEFLNNN